MGARPWRSGSAKFDLPSPPYVVPSSENSAVFCEMGRSWPSHRAQPWGAKLNGKMRISATNGSAMTLLGWRREDAEQRDDEVDAQVGLEVLVRLVAPSGQDHGGVEGPGRRVIDVGHHVEGLGRPVPAGADLTADLVEGGHRMR